MRFTRHLYRPVRHPEKASGSRAGQGICGHAQRNKGAAFPNTTLTSLLYRARFALVKDFSARIHTKIGKWKNGRRSGARGCGGMEKAMDRAQKRRMIMIEMEVPV